MNTCQATLEYLAIMAGVFIVGFLLVAPWPEVLAALVVAAFCAMLLLLAYWVG